MTRPHLLPAKMDVHAASELKTWLLGTTPPVDLSAADVESLSTPGLQILLAAQAHFRTRKAQFTITDPSKAFTDALEDFGLSPEAFAA